MKKNMLAFALALMGCILLLGCDNKALEDATASVEKYNAVATEYNKDIQPYNDAVEEVREANKTVTSVCAAAQVEINKGEQPFDPETLKALKGAMSDVENNLAEVSQKLDPAPILTINEDMEREELEEVAEKADLGLESLAATIVPDAPSVPDYTEGISLIESSLTIYKDSVQGLKQITAPSDAFVMDRLRRIGSITEMAPVTEDHDPNGKLNKQGGYIGCIYFRDDQVDASQLYVDESEDVVEIGTVGGGAIEIFSTVEDAETRNDYLAAFDGAGMLSSGSHLVAGTLLIRTSDELTASQQEDLTQAIVDALVSVE